MFNTNDTFQDTAQVCLNGHLINDSVHRMPEYSRDYCGECGEKTITNCQKCQNRILGHHYVDGLADFTALVVPKHCESCGRMYPWTETAYQALGELLAEQNSLSQKEKHELEESFKSVTTDNPKTEIAAFRIKKYSAKIGKPLGSMLINIVSGVATETAKKHLGI